MRRSGTGTHVATQKAADHRSVRQRCVDALAKACLDMRPATQLNSIGYLSDFREALVEGVSPSAFVDDLQGGAGQELQSKFLAPHSSSALAVNSFGWFAGKDGQVALGDHKHLSLVGFEQKFPTGLASAQPPNLDVVLDGEGALVAVESKCLEYLSPKVPIFSTRYRDEISDERCDGPWYKEMLRILDGRDHGYRHLDVAQLIKHALGLSYRQSRNVVLVYLWWEPSNADEFPIFCAHREEISRLSMRVKGGDVVFHHMSYDELWSQWHGSSESALRTHANLLQKRYLREI